MASARKTISALAMAIGLSVGVGPASAQDQLPGYDPSNFGRVVLNNTQFGGPQFEAAFGAYNNESIREYSPESVFAQMGRAVGRLDILTDERMFPCTAFIISERHLLTNWHCVPGITSAIPGTGTRIEEVRFVAGYTQQGVSEGTDMYVVNPVPVEYSEMLDYAVLEVQGNPAATYGKLDLTDRVPANGDPYWIIGHPHGEAQRISREQCKANSPAISDDRLLHTCDTLPGNSGSPVIDASLQKVVALHHAGSSKDAVNFAIPMATMLAHSTLLRSFISGPKPRLCDRLYSDARMENTCAAYQSYAGQCQGHQDFLFVSAYLSAQCPDYTPDPATIVITPDPTPEPVPTPEPDPTPETLVLRPWCTFQGLTPTETTICNDRYLAELDEEMQRAYEAQNHFDRVNQIAWLRGERDACGQSVGCIANAYAKRISALATPPAPNPNPNPVQPPPSGPVATKGNFTLPNAQCYIVVAARPTYAEAIQFIQTRLADTSQVRLFQSNNGYYGITYRVMNRSEADYWINQWRASGTIPGDSYCASGNRYHSEFAWREGAAPPPNPTPNPTPTPSFMWVNNNKEGGLNLRSGPGTNFPYFDELDIGTRVAILGSQGKWSNIRTDDGRTGWVSTPFLISSQPYVRQCKAYVVKLGPRSTYNTQTGAGFLAVREGPSTRNRLISELYAGDSVKIVAQRNGWARLECVSGGCLNPYRGTAKARGWSSMKYLSIQCN